VGRKPNFFILGAPKCGTTALFEYLRSHPGIFVPRVKEPHFFATDLGSYPAIKTAEAYAALFRDARPDQPRLGEASVYYLRSATAAANIRQYQPEARLVAMFRNPVDMLHSFHSQLLYVAEETVEDFEAAWRLQERRARGLDLPRGSRGAFLLQYREMGRFGSQTERVLRSFPADQLKLILFDDFAADPKRVYHEVIEFLGLPSDDRAEFPRINDNKRARVTWLRNFLRKPPPVVRNTYRSIKRTVGGARMDALKSAIVRRNTVREHRAPLSPAFRAELTQEFRDEIALLGKLMGRDLSHWSTGATAPSSPKG
jgi:hypothetical protein